MSDATSGSANEPTIDSEHLSDEIASDNQLIADSLGGWQGMLESGFPALSFALVYFLSSKNLHTALVASLIAALVLGTMRKVRGGSLQNVASGFIGIGISAYLTTKTGKAENFFLPGILTNAAYFTACLISLLVRKPLVGFVVGSLKGDLTSWLTSPRLRKEFSALTWLWTMVFGLRLLVTVPLYLSGSVTSLGFAKIALGWPLFLLAGYISFRVLNRVQSDEAIPSE